MNIVLQRLKTKLSTDKGQKVPPNITIADIQNISFHSSPGSEEWKFNVWLKPHTGIHNRTTFSIKMKSLEQCIQIKKLMDDEINANFDDLFDLGSNDEVEISDLPIPVDHADPLESVENVESEPSSFNLGSDKSDDILCQKCKTQPIDNLVLQTLNKRLCTYCALN